jgi:hypothetical protein
MAGQSVSVQARTSDNAAQAAEILAVMEIPRYIGIHAVTAATPTLTRVLVERTGRVSF